MAQDLTALSSHQKQTANNKNTPLASQEQCQTHPAFVLDGVTIVAATCIPHVSTIARDVQHRI